MNILEVNNLEFVQTDTKKSEPYVNFDTRQNVVEADTSYLSNGAYYLEERENIQGKPYGSPSNNWLRITNTNWTLTEDCYIEIVLDKKTIKSKLNLDDRLKEIEGTSYIVLQNNNNYGNVQKIRIYKENWVADIFTTTTTAVTEFAESVSTSVSAVGGMFYQGGQMTFLGTLSLLTAGTLLVIWAVRTIRRLIGR